MDIHTILHMQKWTEIKQSSITLPVNARVRVTTLKLWWRCKSPGRVLKTMHGFCSSKVVPENLHYQSVNAPNPQAWSSKILQDSEKGTSLHTCILLPYHIWILDSRESGKWELRFIDTSRYAMEFYCRQTFWSDASAFLCEMTLPPVDHFFYYTMTYFYMAGTFINILFLASSLLPGLLQKAEHKTLLFLPPALQLV